MDEEISVEKPQNYNELINIIKNEFLLGDDELEGTILIFEDEINGGKSKLIPQVFNQFINQNNPILYIEVQENSKIYNEALNMPGDFEDKQNKIFNKENKEEDKKQFNKYEEIVIDQNILNEIKTEKNTNEIEEEPSKEMVISRILEKAKIQKEMKKKKEIEKEGNNNIITNNETQNENEIKQLEKLTHMAEKEEKTFINSMNKTKENKIKKNKKENKMEKKKETKKDKKKDIKKDKTKDNIIQDPLDNKFNDLSEELIKETIMSTSKITGSNISTTIHKDIQCNGCGMESIYGIRYKCTICPNFNFCSICENNKQHEHPFLKIRFPIDK